MEYFGGTLRIKKLSTIKKWIEKGWWQREIDAGWIFNPACGRFKKSKCECCRCRKKIKSANETLSIISKMIQDFNK